MIYNMLAQTPGGQQLLLNMAIAGEEDEESLIYNQVNQHIDDTELKSLSSRHHDDEMRHAKMFRACLDRLGLDYTELPAELRILRGIHRTGQYFNGVQSDEDIVSAYAMLYVIEQRGVEDYTLTANAFDVADPQTAAVYRSVIGDELHHLKVCTAIGTRYAGSEAAWQQAVAKAQQLEALVLQEVGVAAQNYLVAQKVLVAS